MFPGTTVYYQPGMLMGGSIQHKLVLCFQAPPCITSPACWWVDLSNTNLSYVSRHHRVLPARHVDGWIYPTQTCPMFPGTTVYYQPGMLMGGSIQHKLVLCFQAPPCITSPACWWVDLSNTNLSYVSRHHRVLPARHVDGWIYPTQTCPMFPGTTVYYQPGMLMGGSIQHKLVLCFQAPPCITSPACWWVDLSNTNLSYVSRHHRVLPARHVDGWIYPTQTCPMFPGTTVYYQPGMLMGGSIQHKLVLCFQAPPCITSPAYWWVDLSNTNLSYVSRHHRVLPARHVDGWIYPTQTCPMFPGTTVYYQPGMLMGGSIQHKLVLCFQAPPCITSPACWWVDLSNTNLSYVSRHHRVLPARHVDGWIYPTQTCPMFPGTTVYYQPGMLMGGSIQHKLVLCFQAPPCITSLACWWVDLSNTNLSYVSRHHCVLPAWHVDGWIYPTQTCPMFPGTTVYYQPGMLMGGSIQHKLVLCFQAPPCITSLACWWVDLSNTNLSYVSRHHCVLPAWHVDGWIYPTQTCPMFPGTTVYYQPGMLMGGSIQHKLVLCFQAPPCITSLACWWVDLSNTNLSYVSRHHCVLPAWHVDGWIYPTQTCPMFPGTTVYYQPGMLMGGSIQHKLVLCFQAPPCITSPACWWVDLSNTNLSYVSRHHRVLPARHVDGWIYPTQTCPMFPGTTVYYQPGMLMGGSIQHKLVLCFQAPLCITSLACWWVDLSNTNLSYVSRHHRVLPARHVGWWIYPTQTCPMFPGTTVYYQPGMLVGGSIQHKLVLCFQAPPCITSPACWWVDLSNTNLSYVSRHHRVLPARHVDGWIYPTQTCPMFPGTTVYYQPGMLMGGSIQHKLVLCFQAPLCITSLACWWVDLSNTNLSYVSRHHRVLPARHVGWWIYPTQTCPMFPGTTVYYQPGMLVGGSIQHKLVLCFQAPPCITSPACWWVDLSNTNLSYVSRHHRVLPARHVDGWIYPTQTCPMFPGTTVYYQPGMLMGGYIQHDCNVQRGIGYYMEALLCLGAFTKKPISAVLRGITNDQLDPSVRLWNFSCSRHLFVMNVQVFWLIYISYCSYLYLNLSVVLQQPTSPNHFDGLHRRSGHWTTYLLRSLILACSITVFSVDDTAVSSKRQSGCLGWTAVLCPITELELSLSEHLYSLARQSSGLVVSNI